MDLSPLLYKPPHPSKKNLYLFLKLYKFFVGGKEIIEKTQLSLTG